MKKFTAILMAALMVLSLAACGGSGNGQSSNAPATNPPATQAPASSSEPENTEAPEATQAPENPGTNDLGVDMSQFPADFSEWTGENMLNYFKAAVPALSTCEDWHQEHTFYWEQTPINEAYGTWNDDGSIQVEIYTFNTELLDCTQEDVDALKQALAESPAHSYEGDFIFDMTSHMAGNFLVSYELSFDEDAYNALEAAWQSLVSALNIEVVY